MVAIYPLSRAQSKTLSNVAALCALLVVAIHVPVDVSRCAEHSVFGFWLLLFHEGFARAAVPMFFFVSGYLLAGHFGDEGWYMAAIRKRIRTLLIPYVALNILLLLCVILGKAIKGPSNSFDAICDWRYVIGSLGLLPWVQPINFPLWYLRCLIYFVLLTPIIKILIENRILAIATVICLFILAEMILYLSAHESCGLSKINWITNLDIYGLAAFTIGCVARLHPFRIFKIIGSIGFFGALVVLLGTLAIYATWVLLSNPTRQLLILAKGIGVIPICTLAIYKLACKLQFPLIIGRNTMPLFGLQVIVYFVGGIIMSSLGTSLHVRSLSMYIAIWACVSAGCIAIGVALDSLSPRFRSIIFGGR